MNASCKSMASALWTTIKSVLLTSALNLRDYSVAVETILKWACWNAALDLKTSSSTAASETQSCMSLLNQVSVYVQSLKTIFSTRRDSKYPEPPPGTKWKEVRHDNKVTWLVSWTENIQGSIKYIMLNPSSRIKVGFCLFCFVFTTRP